MGTLREVWLRHPWWQRCVYCGHEARTQDHIRPRMQVRNGDGRIWGPAPYVGCPFVYEWRLVRDQFDRVVPGESRIRYLPHEYDCPNGCGWEWM